MALKMPEGRWTKKAPVQERLDNPECLMRIDRGRYSPVVVTALDLFWEVFSGSRLVASFSRGKRQDASAIIEGGLLGVLQGPLWPLVRRS
jgi:hypothetical protein